MNYMSFKVFIKYNQRVSCMSLEKLYDLQSFRKRSKLYFSYVGEALQKYEVASNMYSLEQDL